jgi:hypothetical protein
MGAMGWLTEGPNILLDSDLYASIMVFGEQGFVFFNKKGGTKCIRN